ncbi:MAG TPA: branched-chain amino acid ABC transporter permease [Chloroflexota bacterium]|jgi:branched-chain amino acid transport system permease protein|nr:branched-chain amino acid ABC transporter permease [Chloroflexota bacterium]
MDTFLQQLVNGITVGSFYALVALGYTMVYGVIRLINFAHGDLYMVGAFAGFTLLGAFGGALQHASAVIVIPLAFIVPMAAVGLLGVVIERLAYRPLRRAPRLSPLITAVGLSLALETGAMLIWGASFQVFPGILPTTTWQLGGVSISAMQVLILPVTVGLMAVLYLFVQRTMIGKAMRAVAIDQDAAVLMGIDVDTLISLTFFIGGMLAAAAGVMAGSFYSEIDFNMGFLIGLKAFTAAVLGGIGNIPGAMLGGYVLGLLETFAAGYISSAWKDVFAFSILILVLVFRPTGILGERVVEKV